MLTVTDSLEGSKDETSHTQGNPIRLSAGSSAATLEARREWQERREALKEGTYDLEYYIQQGYHSELNERVS